MKDGATIFLESSWALNVLESKEAANDIVRHQSWCGNRCGNEFPSQSIDLQSGKNGLLTEESISAAGNIAFFEGDESTPECLEAKQWLEAIRNDTEPLGETRRSNQSHASISSNLSSWQKQAMK